MRSRSARGPSATRPDGAVRLVRDPAATGPGRRRGAGRNSGSRRPAPGRGRWPRTGERRGVVRPGWSSVGIAGRPELRRRGTRRAARPARGRRAPAPARRCRRAGRRARPSRSRNADSSAGSTVAAAATVSSSRPSSRTDPARPRPASTRSRATSVHSAMRVSAARRRSAAGVRVAVDASASRAVGSPLPTGHRCGVTPPSAVAGASPAIVPSAASARSGRGTATGRPRCRPLPATCRAGRSRRGRRLLRAEDTGQPCRPAGRGTDRRQPLPGRAARQVEQHARQLIADLEGVGVAGPGEGDARAAVRDPGQSPGEGRCGDAELGEDGLDVADGHRAKAKSGAARSDRGQQRLLGVGAKDERDARPAAPRAS